MHTIEQVEEQEEKNIIDQERFKQIRAGYYYLKARVLQDLLRDRPNKFSSYLIHLKEGLINHDKQLIDKALENLSNKAIATKILQPENHSHTPKKFLDLVGEAEPFTTIQVIVNNYKKYLVKVDKDGQFAIDDIELNFGDNELIYYNEEFFFIKNQLQHFHIHLKSAYPFRGLNDPLTQKKFHDNEVNMIIRCKSCDNFMYDFSVEENGGECAMPNCYHKEFYTGHDMEYWE